MRIGVINRILGSDAVEEQFQRAASAGAEGIEVFYTSPNGAKLLGQADQGDQLAALAAKCKIEIPSLTLAFLMEEPALFGPPATVERAQENIARALALAGRVGSKVVLVPFFGKNTIESETELNRSAESLLPLVEQAEDLGVTLGVESTLNIQQTQFLMSYLGKSDFVKTYFDTGNALSKKINPATAIRELGKDSIAQIHFKDVKLVEGARPDFNVNLGEGDTDFRAVVQALRAVDFDGWIILETPAGADAMVNIKKNLAYAQDLLEE